MRKNIILLAFAYSAAAGAQNFALRKTISVGNNNRWDYLAYEGVNRNIFVSNAVQTIVVSSDHKRIIAIIPHTVGVHGIAVDTKNEKAYISNGRANSIYAVGLKDFSVKDSAAVHGSNPDAIMVDTSSGNIFVFNGKSNNVNVFRPKNLQLVADIPLPGKPEFAVGDGRGSIFVNLEDKSMIAQLDSASNTLVNTFDIAPGEEPTGLAIDERNNLLFSVCANKKLVIFDIAARKVMKTIPIGQDPDAIVFDPENRKIFVSNADGTLDIFLQQSRDKYRKLQTLTTPPRSKTLGYDPVNKELYVPTAHFSEKKVVGNSFNINVYSEK